MSEISKLTARLEFVTSGFESGGKKIFKALDQIATALDNTSKAVDKMAAQQEKAFLKMAGAARKTATEEEKSAKSAAKATAKAAIDKEKAAKKAELFQAKSWQEQMALADKAAKAEISAANKVAAEQIAAANKAAKAAERAAKQKKADIEKAAKAEALVQQRALKQAEKAAKAENILQEKNLRNALKQINVEAKLATDKYNTSRKKAVDAREYADALHMLDKALKSVEKRYSKVLASNKSLSLDFKRTAGRVDTLTTKLKNNAKTLKDYASKLTKVAKGGFGGMWATVTGINQSIELLKNGFAGLRFVVGGVVGQFMEAARVSENYRVRLDSVLGSAKEGAAAFKDLASYASQVPYTFQEIMGAAANLAPILAGGREELKSWMPVLGDIAAVSGLTLAETTSNFIKLYSAGAAAADLFRERGINAMLGFLPKVSYTAEESIRKVREAAENESSVFAGVTKRLSMTWDGQVTMLQDKWLIFRNAVMDSEVFNWLKVQLFRLNSYFDQNKEAIDAIAVALGSWSKAKLEVFRNWLVDVLDGTINIGKEFDKITGYISWILAHPIKWIFSDETAESIQKQNDAFEARVQKYLDEYKKAGKEIDVNKLTGPNGNLADKSYLFGGNLPEEKDPRVEAAKRYNDILEKQEQAEKDAAADRQMQIIKEFGLKTKTYRMSAEQSNALQKIAKDTERATKKSIKNTGSGFDSITSEVDALKEKFITIKNIDAATREYHAVEEAFISRKIELERKLSAVNIVNSDDPKKLTEQTRKEQQALIDSYNSQREALAKKYAVPNVANIEFQTQISDELKAYEAALRTKKLKKEELDLTKKIKKTEQTRDRAGLDDFQKQDQAILDEMDIMLDELGKSAPKKLKELVAEWGKVQQEALDADRLQDFKDRMKDLDHATKSIGFTAFDSYEKGLREQLRIAREELHYSDEMLAQLEGRLRDQHVVQIDANATQEIDDLNDELNKVGMNEHEKAIYDINKRIAEMRAEARGTTTSIDALEEKLRKLNDIENPITKKDGWISGLKTFEESLETEGETMKTMVGDVATGMRDSMRDTFIGAMKGDFENFGDYLTNLFDTIVNSITNMIATNISNSLMNSLVSAEGTGGTGFFGSILGAFGLMNAHGNAFVNGHVKKFASGGIFSKPTLFNYADGLGMLGEAGAEAIVPLARDNKTGDLGIKASGMGGPNIHLVIQNNTGVDAQATTSGPDWDGEKYVITTVMDAFTRNRHGLKDVFSGYK